MKILVTGCNGFIGLHLVKRLLKTNGQITRLLQYLCRSSMDVYGIDRNPTPLLDPRFHFEVMDIRTAPKEFISQFDIIYHFAAQADIPMSFQNPEETFDINVNGTKNLLDGFKGKRFVFASSANIYNPQNPYAESKVQCEELIRKSGKPYTILRFFNVYGWGKENLVVEDFIRRAVDNREIVIYGDGNQTRDFIYIADLIEGIFQASLHRSAKNEEFDLGTGKVTSLNQLISIIEKVLGQRLKVRHEPPRQGDLRESRANTDKIEGHIGWRASFGLEDGVKKMLDKDKR